MIRYDTVFRARRLVTAAGEGSGCVGVADGRIAALAPPEAGLEGRRVVELGDDVVLLPGLVDSHVHVNEPGRTAWEGFATATRAAAAGGVTTIIDMPLNSIPPTVDVAALEVKRKSAEDQCFVDVGFWGGAIPGNLGELRGLDDAGVFGFKCFLLPSGVDEFPPLHPADLDGYMSALASFDGLLIVHAEDAGTIDRAPRAHGTRYLDFLASRPRAAENLAIEQVIRAAERTGARVHILHLSSSDALPMIAGARREGIRVTAETCPHYLVLTAEEVPDGATPCKCCPPVREAANRELLWRGLEGGTIDCVVSDHSPCTAELKRLDTGDFGAAWGGISSLEVGLPVVWTEARRRGYQLTDVVRWMAEGPARLVGLRHKGRIEVGYDADLCVFAPDEAFVVDPKRLHHKHPITPYDGRALLGVVHRTWLRGEELAGDQPRGRLLTRGGA
jgi:allantoinase